MDEYRQTLLGRALADVLQEMEGSHSLAPEIGDQLFSIFDDVLHDELRSVRPARSRSSKKKPKPNETPAADGAVELTHEILQLSGHVASFNRFMETWSVHVDMSTRDTLSLDHVPHALPTPSAACVQELLVKLHQRCNSRHASRPV